MGQGRWAPVFSACHIWGITSILNVGAEHKKGASTSQRHLLRISLEEKGPFSRSYGFSSSHVWMWELDHKEGWAPKNWCFWTVLLEKCREPVRDIPLVTKVMRKEARHTQRWDQASGVPPDILEHLPPKKQSLPTLLLCALTSDFTGGCPPPPSRSLCQRVNLQLQLIKFLGN